MITDYLMMTLNSWYLRGFPFSVLLGMVLIFDKWCVHFSCSITIHESWWYALSLYTSMLWQWKTKSKRKVSKWCLELKKIKLTSWEIMTPNILNIIIPNKWQKTSFSRGASSNLIQEFISELCVDLMTYIIF